MNPEDRISADLPILRPLDLLAVLMRHGVDLVVIGGFALFAHEAMRATKDVDIVPDPSPANLDRLWAALEDLEASPLPFRGDFEANEMPLDWERQALDFGGNWILSTRLGRLDILQSVSGVESYAQLHQNRLDIDTEEAGRIWFAGRDDLIAMKRAAGRPQDLLDIERIERGGE